MGWEIANNNDKPFINEKYDYKCPKTRKEVKVVFHFRNSKMCKSDLQKTLIPVSVECSLSSPRCDDCPFINEKLKHL